jgi:hypothetical protein
MSRRADQGERWRPIGIYRDTQQVFQQRKEETNHADII